MRKLIAVSDSIEKCHNSHSGTTRLVQSMDYSRTTPRHVPQGGCSLPTVVANMTRGHLHSCKATSSALLKRSRVSCRRSKLSSMRSRLTFDAILWFLNLNGAPRERVGTLQRISIISTVATQKRYETEWQTVCVIAGERHLRLGVINSYLQAKMSMQAKNKQDN